MEPLRIDDITRAVGGTRITGTGSRVATGISTDTRTLGPGAFFVPLVGDRFDGHDFLGTALEKGAVGSFVAADHGEVRVAWESAARQQDAALVMVSDTLQALHAVAGFYRRSFQDIHVVGVTGSNGKTTTKDLIASILACRYQTVKSLGNFNNEIGLPLSLFRVDKESQAVVLEMGMSGFGEIARLTAVAQPTVGVVTNVGPVHMENLGSMEGIARAKAELVAGLEPAGVAVLNMDDERVRAMSDETRAQVLFYGVHPDAGVRAEDIHSRGEHGVVFTLCWQGRQRSVTVPIPGRHNVWNALAATACAFACGASWNEVEHGLAAVAGERTAMRMQIEVTCAGVTVINDAYNASPASMASALETLSEMGGRRRIAVLGDMLELGTIAPDAHRDLGRWAAEKADLVVAVGAFADQVAAAARAAGLQDTGVWTCSDNQDAARLVSRLLEPGDTVLVKGSRGLQLERVVEAVLAAGRHPAPGDDQQEGGGVQP